MTQPTPQLLKPGEAAAMLRVNRKTINRWANEGRLPVVRTPTGQIRVPRAHITAILTDTTTSR